MFELRVLTGLHRGAALPLSGGQWRIGSSAEAELALYDPGIEAEHCLLERQDESWSLSSRQGQLSDSEGHRVSQITPLQPDTVFALGGVWLTLVSANSEWPADDDSETTPLEALDEPVAQLESAEVVAAPEDRSSVAKRSRSWTGLLILGAGLALSTATVGWVLSGEAAIQQPGKQASKPVPSLREGKETLLRMIKDRELHDRLTLTEENGNLVLQGRLKKTERALVERMLAHFARQYAGALKVIDRTTPLISALPFVIAQINGGHSAHIVTASGRRIFIGDEIDGLRLIALDDKHIEFGGTQHIEVTW
nr:FHA domain-containing protein [uncultured Pseudomonas sp.]